MNTLFHMEPAAARQEARRLLLERSVRTGGPFKLASGRESDFYVDVKQTSLHPRGAALLGQLLAGLVQDIRFDGVGGPTLGADPLATATSLALLAHGREIPAYIVRKESKGHGTGRFLEGTANFSEGAELILIEDVVTTGGSGLLAAERVTAAGYSIAAMICVVDRQEGGAEAIAAAGYAFRPLFTRAELSQ